MNAAAKIAIALTATAAIGVGGFFAYKKLSAKPAPKFEVTTVEKGRIAPRVTATGTLSALVTVQVGAQVSGRIQALMADFNSTVEKGKTIAKLDPQLFEAALDQAKANEISAQGSLVRAQVQAADTQRQYKRSKELADKKLIAQADLDTAQANAEANDAAIDVAKGNLAQARAQLHQAKVNLDYTTIASPINGTVISRSVDVGQTVAASLAAPTLFIIAEDLHKMQVDTAVAEADVGKLSSGMPATFTVDAFPNERFKGTVRQVRNAAQTLQNVVTYDAVLDVGNPELKLKPGMTANVTFVWAERDDVLRLANAALRFKPSATDLGKSAGVPAASEGQPRAGRREEGGGFKKPPSDEKTVWLLNATGSLEAAKVKVGVTDGTVTEIISGLNEGDQVVTESNDPSAPKTQRQGGQNGPPMGGPPGGGGMRRVF